jgi:REP element-mobilizing transposase RayT
MPALIQTSGMARGIRVEYAGAFYHVMARGNRRQEIFFDDGDRRFFLKTLAEACERTGWRVHAWVLMKNHYHILIETPVPNLVEGMKWLQNTYTRRLNTKHRLWGRVFGDRYKAVLVEGGNADYFTTLLDYIHLNPARAGTVKVAEGASVRDYPWSSVRMVYATGGAKRLSWSCVAAGFEAFELRDTAAGRREFVERLDKRAREELTTAGVVPVPVTIDARLSHLRRGWYWGSQSFAEKALALGKGLIKSRRNSTYRSGPIYRAHDAGEAERILEAGLKRLRTDVAELEKLSGSDVNKVAMAELLSSKTSASQAWIASELRMKSAANVSQQLRRIRSADGARRKRYEKAKKILSDIFD